MKFMAAIGSLLNVMGLKRGHILMNVRLIDLLRSITRFAVHAVPYGMKREGKF